MTPHELQCFCRRGLLLGLAAVVVSVLTGCDNYFRLLPETRRLASELRAEFNKAVEASNHAVMADTEEASVSSAREAVHAGEAAQRTMDALAPLLRRLRDAEALRALDAFGASFARYQTLDRTILALAVENTNLKAQRLSFGPAREAAAAFRRSLHAIKRAAPPASACKVEALVAAAVEAVLEIQVLHAPHIAESDDAAMTRMEQEMDERRAAARDALRTLSDVLSPASRTQLSEALAALDRFWDIHGQILALSRKNTNVRSLALALGPLRTLITACEGSLDTLQGTLAKQGIRATR